MNPPAYTQSSLAALGINELEERLYCALLAHGASLATDISELLSVQLQETTQLLDGIEAKGLATHSPGQPRLYNAVPPGLAIEALASQRHAEIERARQKIAELEKFADNAQGQKQEQLVEVISNRDTLWQITMHLHRTAQKELFGFIRLPVSNSHQEAIRPGLRYRSVSDLEFVQSPGAIEGLSRVAAMGEEVRVFPTLPIKMFIMDRRIGLILNAGSNSADPILLVRESPLLDALCALFELIWERATPLAFSERGAVEQGATGKRLSDAAKQMIPRLAAGVHDKSIAFEEGVSAVTLNRRISELMKHFDARTRFQLGWCAALEAFPERASPDKRS
ncbi:helix-turn-helix domain-containing protein [Rhodanobacter sp. L36]|uniref:TrmB family transcriptional regulator n=1 Tax=Rhodanobacter sp. L36 TaxID=1747221 RepID=UPI00131CB278|nr:helix-turn-helix domain-containing protein [Rhodanobacter sp. L36]